MDVSPSNITLNTDYASSRFKRDYNDQFFKDGVRLVDYILVYEKGIADERKDIYFENLLQLGLEMEEEDAVIQKNLVFVKIHTPRTKLYSFAKKYDIPFKKLAETYFRPEPLKCKILRNELTAQDPLSPNFHRAEPTFSGNQPLRCLRNERFLVTYNVLKRIPFGRSLTKDIGIHNLLNYEVFIAAFPPHDGTSIWNSNPSDPLNDRQLLRKFWSSPRNFFKRQPLDVIERYYGANVAIYFAWMSFYNKMLIVPIIVGVTISLLNYFLPLSYADPAKQVLNSNKLLCPRCEYCPVTPLRDSYAMYKIANIIDTEYTVAYATLVSFWASVYLILWKRKEAILTCRWNIAYSSLEEHDIRPEFENFAKHAKITELGLPALYIPLYIKFVRKFVSLVGCIFLTCLSLYFNYLLLTLEFKINVMFDWSFSALFLSSLINTILILILQRVCIMLYEPIVARLVEFEMPERQTDFDNSYILKMFIFSFINNYTALLYYAFFKGRFFTHPNDPRFYTTPQTVPLIMDQCSPAGCVVDVFTLLLFLITVLPISTQICNYIYTTFTVWYRQKRTGAADHMGHIPRWEKDYVLSNYKQEHLLKLYEEMVVEFGFVTMFSFAIPAAPLIAMINNIIKIHIDAHIMVVKKKRPQTKRTANIGSWIDIMRFITFFSIFTNACLMVFTSDIVLKAKLDDNEGYVNYTLSEYRINLDHWTQAGVPNGTICYYPGMRNPPDSDEPYEVKKGIYFILLIKCFAIIFVEHIIILLSMIVAYIIPSEPHIVRVKHAAEIMTLRKNLMPTMEVQESIIRLLGK